MSDFHRRNQAIVFYNPCISVAETLRGVSLDEFIVIYSEQELLQFITCKFWSLLLCFSFLSNDSGVKLVHFAVFFTLFNWKQPLLSGRNWNYLTGNHVIVI